MSKRSKYCLIGLANHQGVLNVGGRLGAAEGPRAFRRVMERMSGRFAWREALVDAGDFRPSSSEMPEILRQAADAITKAHRGTGLSVVIGGGHDFGYAQLSGVAKALGKKRLGCINIDAHLDVRKPEPEIGSGSPFYVALEEGVLDPKRFVEFGIQSHCNAPALWDYVGKKRIKVIPFADIRGGKAVARFKATLKTLRASCDAIVISLDLDAAAAAFAPGVSAPQAEGFSSSEIIEMMEIAGADAKVVSLGIFELNPLHDEGERTARLAATAAFHFAESALS